MRYIFAIPLNGEDYIFINRGKNNFLFTDRELGKARERYNKNKEVVDEFRKMLTESRRKK